MGLDQWPLRISTGSGVRLGNSKTLDGLFDEVRKASDDGIGRVWLAQDPWGQDALTHIAVVGREVPQVELGTAVIATYPRHPAVLAAQALTVNAAIGGRLILGIGTSHRFVIEHFYGIPFDGPATHSREFLSTLLPLLADQLVPRGGGRKMDLRLAVPDAAAPPVYMAALGPKMLDVCGELTCGTITWLSGPKVLSEHIRPRLDAAAAKAGRPRPEVVCGLPICVTDDEADVRGRIATHFEEYNQAPSYRDMMDRGGAAGPADVAIVGTESEVTARLHELADVGVDEFVAVEFGTGAELARTRALLCEGPRG